MQSPVSAPGRGGITSTSSIRVPAPGEDVSRNWTSIAQVASAVVSVAAGLQGFRDEFTARQPVSQRLIELHPFKIYRLPSYLRTTSDPTMDWRRFRVRAGRVLAADATGTDAAFDPAPNANPDSEYVPMVSKEILAPINVAQFWFWLEVGSGGTTAVVRYGPTPTASSYSDGPNSWTSANPWTLAPVPDSAHIPIGWVDTKSQQASYTAVIRQLLRADLVGGVGGGSTFPVWL